MICLNSRKVNTIKIEYYVSFANRKYEDLAIIITTITSIADSLSPSKTIHLFISYPVLVADGLTI